MRHEKEPSPKDLDKLNKREEALENLEEDFAHGLSESDEEFEKESEETMKELEKLGVKRGADYEKVKEIGRKKNKEQKTTD